VSAGLEEPAVSEGIRTVSSRADREHRLEQLCVRAKYEVTALYYPSLQLNPNPLLPTHTHPNLTH
jgi:hypothetical protein